MSAELDFNILTNSRFDAKWLKIDLQDALKRHQLAQSWNELIKDGEIYGDFSETLLNGVGVAARKGEDVLYSVKLIKPELVFKTHCHTKIALGLPDYTQEFIFLDHLIYFKLA